MGNTKKLLVLLLFPKVEFNMHLNMKMLFTNMIMHLLRLRRVLFYCPLLISLQHYVIWYQSFSPRLWKCFNSRNMIMRFKLLIEYIKWNLILALLLENILSSTLVPLSYLVTSFFSAAVFSFFVAAAALLSDINLLFSFLNFESAASTLKEF